MKKLLTIIGISLAILTSFGATRSDVSKIDSKDMTSRLKKSTNNTKPERFTANYYKQEGKAKSLKGKIVTIYITESKLYSSDKEGYQKFECETYYNKKKGGTVIVYVPNQKAELFYKLYKDVEATASVSNSKNTKKKKKEVYAIRPIQATLHYANSSMYFITN